MTISTYALLAAYGLGWLAITIGPWLIGLWLVCALIEAIGRPKTLVITNAPQNEAQATTEQQEPPPRIQVVSWKAWHDRKDAL